MCKYLLIVALVLLTGCAGYEFGITTPFGGISIKTPMISAPRVSITEPAKKAEPTEEKITE